MKKVGLALLGGALGVALAYINRPKYMGGLVDPIKDSLTSPHVDRAAVQDWLPTVLTYSVIGIVVGFALGVILSNSRHKSDPSARDKAA